MKLAVGQLDPVHLLGGRGREPRNEHRHDGRGDSREDAVDRDPDDGAPAHRGEPTAMRTQNDASTFCYVAPEIRANVNHTPPAYRGDEKWVLE